MKTKTVILLCGLALGLGLALSPWARAAGGGCRDLDGDGYGRNCAPGPDCDDANARIHPNADEICDGKDNDCSGFADGAVLDSGTCNTGLIGRCGVGSLTCENGTMVCHAFWTPTAETCNDLDDNCDGLVDNVAGTDADGDGRPAACDCDDGDPLINVQGQVDSAGKRYCVQIDPVSATVGQPAAVTVRGFHESGVYSLTLNQDADLALRQTFSCGGQTKCVASTTVNQAYEGQGYLEAILYKSFNGFVDSTSRKVSFTCGGEYCPPDPEIGDFMSWMRSKRYDECVASKYLEPSTDGLYKTIQKDFLEERPAGFSQSVTLDYWDVVPTDPQATWISVGPGEGRLCTPYAKWPSWCPAPVTADVGFLERHFERTFGVNFTFVYHRMEIDYSDTFENPVKQVITPEVTVYNFPGSRFTFLSQFAPGSIVHFGVETWQEPGDPLPLYIQNMSGGGIVTTVDEEPDTVLGVITSTHEWGHGLGWPHNFFTEHWPAVEVRVALDGIMDNTYLAGTDLIDPIDPLERYAFEPLPGGYLDDATFGPDYSNGITFTYLLPKCDNVDPALVSGAMVQETPADYTFDLSLTNHGALPVGYVRLTAVDSVSPSTVYADRVLGRLGPGESRLHRVTIPKSALQSNFVVFTLDPANAIAESHAGHNAEADNQITVPRCADADGDGYLACVNDCDDTRVTVHPGATETCNLRDDDCDLLVDELPEFDRDQDGFTTCEGDCDDQDPRINGIEDYSQAFYSCFDTLDNDCDGTADWDCAVDVSHEHVKSGVVSPNQPGGLANMKAGSPDDVYESIKETTSGKRVEVYWTFTGLSFSTWYDLRVEAQRSSATGDWFDFAWGVRTAAGPCTDLTGETYSAPLRVDKVADDDHLQFVQLGPPPAGFGDDVSFCIRVLDGNPAGSDGKADTLKIDKLYLMPVILDARAGSETTEEGTRFQGSYLNTQTAGIASEGLREGPPNNRLIHTYTFPNVPVGRSHKLYFQATRATNAESDDFKFQFALPLADGTPGAFADIPGAVVSTAVAPGAVLSGSFGPDGMKGTVFIRVVDTNPTGSSLDSVLIDYLAIKTPEP